MFKPMFNPKTLAIAFMETVMVVGFAGLCGARAADGPSRAAADAPSDQGAWQEEFNDVCSKTQDAMTLSSDKLTLLVHRCDALLPQLEKLDETRKKVFMLRLQRCRSLYAYVLDSKKNEKK